jgi:hypothetical protein
MSESANEHPKKVERPRARRLRISLAQIAIELHASRLRSHLGVTEFCSLSHEDALRLIPNCEIHAIKNLKGILFETVAEFHNGGRHIGALAVKIGRGVQIAFNDAYPVDWVRVHLMEEFFHIRLGHPPDTVRVYAMDGRYRTYDQQKEDEAYGCAIAALLPFPSLQHMVAHDAHVARIAERYVVPIPVVEERIAMTGLGELVSSRQLRLLA